MGTNLTLKRNWMPDFFTPVCGINEIKKKIKECLEILGCLRNKYATGMSVAH